MSVVVDVPSIQAFEFAFNVVTVHELVLNNCNPGLSSILGFPALVAILLSDIVGNVDCAVK